MAGHSKGHHGAAGHRLDLKVLAGGESWCGLGHGEMHIPVYHCGVHHGEEAAL